MSRTFISAWSKVICFKSRVTGRFNPLEFKLNFCSGVVLDATQHLPRGADLDLVGNEIYNL